MPPLLDVGSDELIRAGGQESLAQTGAMGDAAGADPGGDADLLQTLDLVDVDDIEAHPGHRRGSSPVTALRGVGARA